LVARLVLRINLLPSEDRPIITRLERLEKKNLDILVFAERLDWKESASENDKPIIDRQIPRDHSTETVTISLPARSFDRPRPYIEEDKKVKEEN
jgi:hypothetical protein